MPKIINNTALRIPDILLPKKSIDLYKWSVIACDQFTSNEEYWNKVKNIISTSPSTLNLILPEVYLKNTEKIPQYLSEIKSHAEKYTEEVFVEHKNCILLIDRATATTQSRKGIMMQVDLAHYEVDPNSDALIKSTEQIVKSRLPHRIEVRKNTNLDLSHIIMCYNDKSNTLIQELSKNITELAFETDLMCNGGHVKAHFCNAEASATVLENFFTKLQQENKGLSKALFAVGDGNHSLMSAKQTWLDNGANMDDPNRWALVELINIFDEGLPVEPIHRILFNAKTENIISFLQQHGKINNFSSINDAENSIPEENKYSTSIIIHNDKYYTWTLNKNNENKNILSIEILEAVLSEQTELYTDIDFIHHKKEVLSLCRNNNNNVGILLPAFPRDAIFNYVHAHQLFPRKSFSLGEAEEKIYYICAVKR